MQMLPPKSDQEQQGFALVLVLCFVALLSVLVVAFFSNAALQRTISDSSASQIKVDLFAQGAVDSIVGDLKQEIVDGSTNGVTKTAGGTPVYTNASGSITYVYYPTTNTTAVPNLVGSNTNVPNLVKVSTNLPFYSGSAYAASGVSRASTNVSTNASLNGRSISLARWNKPLFLAPTSTSDFTPSVSNPPIPTWIYVDRSGSNPTTWNNNMQWSATNTTTVIGRYAYTIYNEGGLLDANVAGYPPTNASTLVLNTNLTYKSAEAFADLTQLTNANGQLLSSLNINTLINWRNAATTQGGTNSANYVTAILGNQSGFLRTANTTLYVNNNSITNSDSMFASRQQLINFFMNQMGGSTNTNTLSALQYFTTFSRGLDQPSYAPATNRPKVLLAVNGGNSAAPDLLPSPVDDLVNPKFLGVRVTTTFQRNDGTQAQIGEPLVKKRFPLNRLAWLTYKGPSANRTQSDADIQALIKNGIPWSYLQQGTTNNIAKSFGLSWDSSNNQWKYDQHNGATGSGSTGAINKLADLANLTSPRDPDFFELLKATINVGSVGKALLPSGTAMPADTGDPSAADQPYNYNYYLESSVDVQILKIGANIISQFQTANYPPRIVFNDGSGAAQMPTTVVGIANLPYLSQVITGAQLLQTNDIAPRSIISGTTNGVGSGFAGSSFYITNDAITNSGVGAAMQYPVVWNPHDARSSVGAAGAGPTQFRVVADSTTPDQAEKGGVQNSFYTYAASDGSGTLRYSYAADPASPGSSWYLNPAGRAITSNNTEIDFTVPSSTAQIFPEPAMLLKPGTVTDSAGNSITVAAGAGNAISGTIAGTTFVSGGGLPDLETDANSIAAPPYVGFYLGVFPLAWYYNMSNAPLSAAKTGFYVARDTGGGVAGASYQSCYMTYRMQYKDPLGNWVTYDTKYGKTFNDNTQITTQPPSIGTVNVICGHGQIASAGSRAGYGGFWAAPVDPRTARFGLLWNGTYPATNGLNSPMNNQGSWTRSESINPVPAYPVPADVHPVLYNKGGWLDINNALLLSLRPDSAGGWNVMAGWPYSGNGGATTGKISANDGTANGWMAFAGLYFGPPYVSGCFPGLNLGALAQNNTDCPSSFTKYYFDKSGSDGFSYTPQYFADPDGVVRRGMGAFIPPGSPPNSVANGSGYNNYLPAKTSVGQPIAQTLNYAASSAPASANLDPTRTLTSAGTTPATSQSQSRPFMLHRPFYSVAELGYVFSDTPWRNLDMSTAESGASALLDTFCIADTSTPSGLVAGKVDLNTKQAPVLQAILASGYFDASQPASSTNATAKIDTNTAALLARALINRTTTNSLQNISDLVGRFVAKNPIRILPSTILTAPSNLLRGILSTNYFSDGKLSYSGFSDAGWDTNANALTPLSNSPASDVYSAYQSSSVFTTNANFNGTKETISNIQRFREAPIRALAAAGQTRVWNLMIDVVSQTGRFPGSANTLSSFNVEGEQRYWVHLAIDRLTGQVIDKQVEVVKE